MRRLSKSAAILATAWIAGSTLPALAQDTPAKKTAPKAAGGKAQPKAQAKGEPKKAEPKAAAKAAEPKAAAKTPAGYALVA